MGETASARSPNCLLRNGIGLIVAVSEKLTYEAMFEAISVATEAKVKALYESKLVTPSAEQRAVGTISDSVIIAARDTGLHFRDSQSTTLKELIGAACLESLRKTVSSDFATVSTELLF